MAADVLSRDYMERACRYKVGAWNFDPALDLYLHLFVNDITPDCFTSAGSYTECTLPGYAAAHLPLAGWSVAPYPTSGSCGWRASFAPWTFSFAAAGQTIYGLWVADVNHAVLCWSKRFDVPFVVAVGGGTLQVQPSVIDMPCA